ncbi:SIMPL domain-containing protein [Patescibacteria group bacterium]|nr:SIMPL domain-containing protein [Patescibacteria group bacterium]
MLNENLQKALGILAVLLGLYLLIQSYNSLQASRYIGQDVMPSNTITVSATGEVFAKPDIAQISVSVVEEAKTVLEAQKKHSESINKIIDYLKNSGVEDKDIKTSAYNIYPQYNWTESQGRIFTGYQITQTLDIKVRDLDKAGQILGGVAEMGANQIGGINFVIDDDDAVKEEARKQAIDKAKEKADKIASDLGIKFGRLVSFYESGDNYPIYYEAKSMGIGGGDSSSAPSIPSGENSITITVNLTYEIK